MAKKIQLTPAQKTAMEYLHREGAKVFNRFHGSREEIPFDKLADKELATQRRRVDGMREYVLTESGQQLAATLFGSNDSPVFIETDADDAIPFAAFDSEPVTLLTDDLLAASRAGWGQRYETLIADSKGSAWTHPFGKKLGLRPDREPVVDAPEDVQSMARQCIMLAYADHSQEAMNFFRKWTAYRLRGYTDKQCERIVYEFAYMITEQPAPTSYYILPVAETQPRYQNTRKSAYKAHSGDYSNKRGQRPANMQKRYIKPLERKQRPVANVIQIEEILRSMGIVGRAA